MMRIETRRKLNNFYKAHPVGTRLVSARYHELDTTVYPAWSTLKKNGAVELVSSELIEYEYTDGIVTEVLYNIYEVKQVL